MKLYKMLIVLMVLAMLLGMVMNVGRQIDGKIRMQNTADAATYSGGVVLARGFDGAGNTIPAMFVNLLTLWGTEIPLSYGLSQWTGLGITGVWVGRAIANTANGLLFAFWFRLGRWKKREV